MFFPAAAGVGAGEAAFAAGDAAVVALFSGFGVGDIAAGGAGLSGMGVVSMAGAGAGVSSIVVAGCSSAGVDVVSSSCAKADALRASAVTAISDVNNLI